MYDNSLRRNQVWHGHYWSVRWKRTCFCIFYMLSQMFCNVIRSQLEKYYDGQVTKLLILIIFFFKIYTNYPKSYLKHGWMIKKWIFSVINIPGWLFRAFFFHFDINFSNWISEKMDVVFNYFCSRKQLK